MKFTKRLLTIALSMGMVMPLCATAYAAPTVTDLSATIIANATDSNLYDVTVTFTVEESSKQLTLLLTGPNTDGNLTDSEIVHINQFGKDVSGEENYFSGSATCNFSVSEARMIAAGAMDETTGEIDGLYVRMNTDDAVDADNAPSTLVTHVVPVTGVTLDKTTLGLVVGEEETLTATVAPDEATNKAVTWLSSDEKVATVDDTGKVTAVNAGEAKITVTTDDGGFTAECTVTVSPAPVDVEGIALDKDTATVYIGKTATLKAIFTPLSATNKNVTWESSNETVATVENGVVTAVAEGEAIITVTTEDGGFTATCTVTVTEAPAFTLGDVNDDGEVDYVDAIMVLKHDSGVAPISDDKLTIADVNNDGDVDYVDAIQILKFDSGLITSFN